MTTITTVRQNARSPNSYGSVCRAQERFLPICGAQEVRSPLL